MLPKFTLGDRNAEDEFRLTLEFILESILDFIRFHIHHYKPARCAPGRPSIGHKLTQEFTRYHR